MISLGNPMHHLAQLKEYSVRRISSYDTSGGNRDAWAIEPGETKTLAEIDGPGAVSHIWFAIDSPEPLYLRKLLLRMYWDGEENPSVDSPVGDFFGLGHGRSFTYQCAPFNTSTNQEGQVGGGVAMNCWLPMPFAEHGRIEIVNQQDQPVRSFYFYIDHQLTCTPNGAGRTPATAGNKPARCGTRPSGRSGWPVPRARTSPTKATTLSWRRRVEATT